MNMLREKFGSPVDGKFKFDWTTKQVLECLSKAASERWYDARAHLKLGILKSLLCALGLMYVARFEFEQDTCGCYKVTKMCYHGFRSFNKLKEVILNDVHEAERRVRGGYFNGVFISGYNFVSAY